MTDENDELLLLRHRVDELERMIARLRPLAARVEHPLRFVFIVDEGGQEQTPNGGTLVDFTGGRLVTTSSLPAGSKTVMEIQDGPTMRYFEIGGGGGGDSIGTAQGEVHIMTVDLADDWELPFLAPIP